MAVAQGIDLQDGVLDWSVKAVILKKYPEVYQAWLQKRYNEANLKRVPFVPAPILNALGNGLNINIGQDLFDRIWADAKGF